MNLPYIEYTAIFAFYWVCWPGKTGGGTPLFLKGSGGEQQEADAVTKQVCWNCKKGFDVWGETIRNDKYSVILETNQHEQLIFKNAISTVVVSKPFHGPMHTNAASAASHSVPSAPIGNGDN